MTSRDRVEIKARIEIFARGREVLDASIRHEEVRRLLQPVVTVPSEYSRFQSRDMNIFCALKDSLMSASGE